MRFRLLFQEMRQSIAKNTLMFIAVILVSFVSFTFVGASILLQTQVTTAKGVWYEKLEISVYMCPNGYSTSANCTGTEASADQIAAIQQLVQSELKDEVQEITVISKEQSFQDLMQRYPDGIIDGQQFTPDDMQVSLKLKLTDPNNYQIVKEVLTNRAGVEEVYDQRQIFDPIFAALNQFTAVAIALAVIMLLSALLLIQTTIRLSASSRKREVEIMRLVGASNSFIRMPFILEGVLSSFIGATLSSVVLAAFTKFYIDDYLAQSVKWMQFITPVDALLVAPIIIGLAVLLSVFSSILSLRRYMKV
ncbi:MAG: permease-like cell division protein FtsX [Bifidobacteriaceae bacterium]|jgi:cell division transport system permease protein|nr:permease-like cell division protein FtsX [Bifidobacteriaceae bacterium]